MLTNSLSIRLKTEFIALVLQNIFPTKLMQLSLNLSNMVVLHTNVLFASQHTFVSVDFLL